MKTPHHAARPLACLGMIGLGRLAFGTAHAQEVISGIDFTGHARSGIGNTAVLFQEYTSCKNAK